MGTVAVESAALFFFFSEEIVEVMDRLGAFVWDICGSEIPSLFVIIIFLFVECGTGCGASFWGRTCCNILKKRRKTCSFFRVGSFFLKHFFLFFFFFSFFAARDVGENCCCRMVSGICSDNATAIFVVGRS